ncbi:VirD4-like conjugal transfer protein, CD1115 family [Peptoniphilaceae bacterium SGI.131]
MNESKYKYLVYFILLFLVNFFIYTEFENLTYNGLATIIIILYFLDKKVNKNNISTRKNIEYGSARWGRYEDIKGFIDPVESKNIIFTETEKMTLNYKLENVEFNRNNNVFVEGGSGTGKTWFYIIPNIIQMYGSYVVTDTKGNLINTTGFLLNEKGYDIKIFNTVDFNKSLKWNPFIYLKNELDILKFVSSFISNTTPENFKADDFWIKSESMYLTALISYILSEYPKSYHSMITLLELHNANKVNEEDDSCVLDELFDELKERKPDSLAVRQYTKFKQGASKTLASILISVSARLSIFDIEEIRNLLSEDELNFSDIARKKVAFFIVTSDTDRSLDFITSILLSQLMNYLIKDCDKNFNGEFKKPVVFLLDEFANCGKIPAVDDVVAVTRSRNIAMSFIVQNRAQLKKNYSKNYQNIVANCDSFLFLGGTEPETLKAVSELLGKETINVENISKSYSQNKSSTNSNSKQGRSLLTPDEVSNISNNKCIYKLRGVAPFFSDKYKIKEHKYYSNLNQKFDLERYINFKRKKETGIVVEKEDIFIEIDLTDVNLDIN